MVYIVYSFIDYTIAIDGCRKKDDDDDDDDDDVVVVVVVVQVADAIVEVVGTLILIFNSIAFQLAYSY
jgi:hypothetical protein